MPNNEAEYEGLSEYERLRLERIKRNEEYLENLGLSTFKKEQMKAMTKPRHSVKRVLKSVVPQGDRRLSKRIKSRSSAVVDDDALVQLSYAEADDENIRVVKQSKASQTVKQSKASQTVKQSKASKGDKMAESGDSHHINAQLSRELKFSYVPDIVLSEAEKKVLSKNDMDQNYLDKFREFLVYHDKISEQNERNVMRQVKKLASGEGVRYESARYGWPEGCYFMKGTKVTPLSDLVDIMQKAIEAENKNGIDRGNGWLLRHPIKKLLLFQQFCLNNPTFLASTHKLATYCKEE